MSKTIIEIDHIQAGQRRPYADHIYEAYITKQGIGVLTTPFVLFYIIKQDEAKQLARDYVRQFPDNPEWCTAKLEILEPIDLSSEQQKLVAPAFRAHTTGARWHVKIVEPYLD